jgi:hypothetical protein
MLPTSASPVGFAQAPPDQADPVASTSTRLISSPAEGESLASARARDDIQPPRFEKAPSNTAATTSRSGYPARTKAGHVLRVAGHLPGIVAGERRWPATSSSTDSMNPPLVGLMMLLFESRRRQRRDAAAATARALLVSAPSGARESRRRDARPTTNAGLRRPSRARGETPGAATTQPGSGKVRASARGRGSPTLSSSPYRALRDWRPCDP